MVTLSKMSHHLIAVHQCGTDRSTEDTPIISYAVQWRSPCPRRLVSSSLPTSVAPTGPQKTRRSPCPGRPCSARQLIPAHQCGSRCDAVAVTVSKSSSHLIPVRRKFREAHPPPAAAWCTETPRTACLRHRPAPR